MHLVLIEGVPGSGKTTLAEQLCGRACEKGANAKWFREEDQDHPVHPLAFKVDKYEVDFADRCLQQWRGFIDSHKGREQLLILEGSALQSSVRFMMEAGHLDLLERYYQAFERLLADICCHFIYLRPADITPHISGIMAHRGADWSEKVGVYLSRSPYCQQRSWSPETCMHLFWHDYAVECDRLIEQSGLENKVLYLEPHSRQDSAEEAACFIGI